MSPSAMIFMMAATRDPGLRVQRAVDDTRIARRLSTAERPGSIRSARGGTQRGAAHARTRRALRALLARMARLEIASPRCVPPCTSEIRHCYWSQVAPLFCLRTRTGFSATAEAPGRGLSQILAEGVWR